MKRYWKKVLRARLRYAVGWLHFHARYALYLAGRAAVWPIQLLLHWSRTRHLRYLLEGLPALVVLALLLTCIGIYQFSTMRNLVSYYRGVADSAIKGKDQETAQIALERLIALEGDSLENRFKLGQVLDALGQSDRGQVLVESAAPLDKTGYPPAHYYRAVQLCRKSNPSPDELLAIETHLLRTIQGNPDALGAHVLLGQYYVRIGKADKAIEHLQKACVAQPELTLHLAVLCAQQGKAELVDYYARLAVDHFQKATEENLDNTEARMAWAEALVLLREYDKAVDVLTEGWRVARTQSYLDALGMTYALWSDQFKKEPAQQLEQLERGLKIVPTHPELLNRLVNLTRIEGPGAAQARAALRKLLTEGKGSAYLHLFLGVDALQHGDLQVAENHLTLAYQLDKGLPAVANNLAWVLSHAKQPDLPRALQLVNSALEHDRNNAHIQETRGQIYLQLGRWKEALADLSAVLPKLSASAELHRSLAKCYAELQMPAMAAQHRQRAEAIEKKRSTAAPP